jgi:DNA-directed RNA polymerase subunit H (RpoH/RPB5)
VNENELLGRVAYLVRAGKLIPVPAELSVVDHLIAKIVRRSKTAARALVYLHRVVETPKESLSCQG